MVIACCQLPIIEIVELLDQAFPRIVERRRAIMATGFPPGPLGLIVPLAECRGHDVGHWLAGAFVERGNGSKLGIRQPGRPCLDQLGHSPAAVRVATFLERARQIVGPLYRTIRLLRTIYFRSKSKSKSRAVT